MAFMTPYYTDEPFVRLENESGEGLLAPAEFESEYVDEDGLTVVDRYSCKWFARLSANGYVDCTDWEGPFDTLAEAREHIADLFEVDPDTGDDLPEED